MPVPVSGVSRPSTDIHRASSVGIRYDIFGSERYALTLDNRAFRELAQYAPYDAVEIVFNSETYGGGGIFGQFSTGASNDLKQATDVARRMVCSYGMSEKIGPVSFADDEHDVFLGRDFVQRKDYSEQKAQEIDEEVSQFLRTLYAEARQILAENRATLDASAALLEREPSSRRS